MENRENKTVRPAEELLSVVTPVYNAAAHLPALYDCLRAQTHTEWEWVVVDDGSTDGSGDLLRRWAAADSRISLYACAASGSAKYPRDMAVCKARSRYVVCIDADDRVEPRYLATLRRRMLDTGADIVYPVMRFTDVRGVCTEELPVPGFDRSAVYNGRDLVADTILEWRIGCNGGLYDKAVWTNLCYPERTSPVWMNSDEVDERIYLAADVRVAFADAVYTYVNHDASITRRFSPKLFHRLKTDRVLLDFVVREFGTSGREYRNVQLQMFYTWRSSMARFVRHFRDLYACRDFIYGDLRENFGLIDPACLSAAERRQFLGLRSFRLLFLLFCLKYAPATLFDKLAIRCSPGLYAFLLFRPKAERRLRRQIAAAYAEPAAAGGVPPCVVSVFGGQASHGGLVDRLRGAVSVYQLCRVLGRGYRLHFVHPFALTDYLVPAAYDWRPAAGEVSFAPGQAERLVLETATNTAWEKKYQRHWLRHRLRRAKGQTHVYTNAAFCYDDGFGTAFRELFRPSPRLQDSLDRLRAQIGAAYVSVSARFLNLMGDFNEENYSEPLPPAEQQTLLQECLARLVALHGEAPSCRLLVCSDSVRFLELAGRLPYVFIVPGHVSHIDNDVPRDYDYYEKTFLDFYMIAGACRVCLLKERRMMNSGFPYAAAQVGGKQCEVITF